MKKKSPIPKIAYKGTDKLAKSFKAKISQTSSDTKYYYGEIKNELLFLKGIKSRTSWKYETFSNKKTPVVRLSVIGKTLCMLLNKKADELDEKYYAEDVSGIKKYEGTPTLIRIKSQRGLKYAKEIISDLGFEKRKNFEKYRMDYNIPYETTEALKAKKLIKIIKK